MTSKGLLIISLALIAAVAAAATMTYDEDAPRERSPVPVPTLVSDAEPPGAERGAVTTAPARPATVVRGRVLGAGGDAPVAGAVVRLSRVEGEPSPLCSTTSDADGAFSLSIDSAAAAAWGASGAGEWERIRIIAEADAGALRSRAKAFPLNRIGDLGELTLRMEPMTHLSGRVVRAGGIPVADALVRVDEVFNRSIVEKGHDDDLHVFRHALRTGGDGRFAVRVRPSRVRIAARGADDAVSRVVAIPVAEDAAACDAGDIELSARPCVLWLRAVDEEGRGIGGATAILESDEAMMIGPSVWIDGREWSLAFASDGTARIPIDRTAGTLVVAVSAPGRRVVTLCVDRRAVTEAGVEVMLPRRPSFVVRLETAAGSRAADLAGGASVSASPRDTSRESSRLYAAYPEGTPVVSRTRGDISPAQRAEQRTPARPFSDDGRPALRVEVEAPGRHLMSVSIPFIGSWHDDVEVTEGGTPAAIAVPVPEVRSVEFRVAGDGADGAAAAEPRELVFVVADDPAFVPVLDRKRPRPGPALTLRTWRPGPTTLTADSDGRYRGFVPVGTRSVAWRWRAPDSATTTVEVPANGEIEVTR